MDIETASYPQMVSALAKPGDDIIKDLTPRFAHILHMAVGMVGEVRELHQAFLAQDEENIIEELGDLYFYLTGFALTHGIMFPKFYTVSEVDEKGLLMLTSIEALYDSTFTLLELTKKSAFYVKEQSSEKIETQVLKTHRLISSVATSLAKVTLEDIKIANKKKLLGKRYASGKYSNDQAQTRADKPVGE